jgi:apolipoprotein N-acyltransferase
VRLEQRTLYARFGDAPFWLLLGLTLALAVAVRRRSP